jgi:hypothetical protein
MGVIRNEEVWQQHYNWKGICAAPIEPHGIAEGAAILACWNSVRIFLAMVSKALPSSSPMKDTMLTRVKIRRSVGMILTLCHPFSPASVMMVNFNPPANV